MTEKQYTNGEITVVWKPDVCIHSTICFKGLPDVFKPKERPWVKIEGAQTRKLPRRLINALRVRCHIFIMKRVQRKRSKVNQLLKLWLTDRF